MGLFYYVCGVIVGFILTVIIHKRHSTSGTIVINYSDPNKDTYRIEIDDLAVLDNKSKVVLSIKREGLNSQK